MKKLIPIMIAAAMLCVVFAAVDVDVDAKSDPHLWVGKTAVTGDVDLPTWSYKKSTNTITFNNYVQTGDDIHEYRLSKSAAIYYDGDKTLKFVIKGTNKIDPNAIYGIVAEGKGGLEFSGNGKLTISNASYHIAIDVDCGLTINGGEYILESKDSSENLPSINVASEGFVMSKGSVTCTEMIHSIDGIVMKSGCIGFLNQKKDDVVIRTEYGGLDLDGDPYTENLRKGHIDSKAISDGNVYISYAGGKTVTFDANGGTCSTTTKTTDAMGNIDSFPEATRDGWLFAGWYTAKEGGERVTSTHFTKDTTIYAQWVNTHFIVFDAQGGVGEVPFEVTNIDGTLRAIPNATHDGGLRFAGWYTEKNGEGDRVTKSTVFHENATVYAFWVNTHIICFNAQGGDAQVWFEVTNIDGTLRMIPTATRDVYTFDGWYTAANGGDRITAETIFNTDAVVYAHWTYAGDPIICGTVGGITVLIVIISAAVLFSRRR